MIKMLVFDLAGTTLDEQNVVYKTVHQAIERAGFELSLDLVLEHGAGKEKFQAICDVLAILDEDTNVRTAKLIFKDFEQLLDEAYAQLEPKPMPKAEEVFEELRQRNIYVVLNTGYQREVAERLLDKLGWEEGTDYDLLVTASDVANGRPEPDMIVAAMRHFGITDSSQVGKIGDSAIDIEEGAIAGCGFTAGITTGAQTEAQLRKALPTYIFNRLDEVLEVI
jgi:phosphonatase-like hydrolase